MKYHVTGVHDEVVQHMIGQFETPIHAAVRYTERFYVRRGECFLVKSAAGQWDFTVVSERPLLVVPSDELNDWS